MLPDYILQRGALANNEDRPEPKAVPKKPTIIVALPFPHLEYSFILVIYLLCSLISYISDLFFLC